MTLRLLCATFLLSLFAFPTAASAAGHQETATAALLHDVVGAGQLRLQSQRLAKLWLQAGLGINAGAASGQLARGVARLDTTLAALSPYARRDDTARQLQRVSALWAEYRAALALPYSDANLKSVNILADELMLASGRLTMKIEAGIEGGGGRLLDLALRQNMLAQRLARLYLQARAGDRSGGRLVDIEQARREFATALNELASARENTPASREALELASVQWIFFEQAIGGLKNGGDSRPQHVATASERIGEVLDAVARQYAGDAAAVRVAAAESVSSGRRN